MKIESYTVANIHEEFGCDWCGAPVYVGDSAYLVESRNRAFCSRYCAKKHEADVTDSTTTECRAHAYDGCPVCFGQ